MIKTIDVAISKAAWNTKADALFRTFLHVQRHKSFQCEDFRMYCKVILPQPKNLRQFSYVIRRAHMSGLITRIGYAATDNIKAHNAIASVWVKSK